MQSIISTSNEFFFLTKIPPAPAPAAAAAAAPVVRFDFNFPNLLINAKEISAKISVDGKIRRNVARRFSSGNFAGKFSIKLTGTGFVDFASEDSIKAELIFVSAVLQMQYGNNINRRQVAFDYLFERNKFAELRTNALGAYVNPAANINAAIDQSKLYYFPIIFVRIKYFENNDNWNLLLEEI